MQRKGFNFFRSYFEVAKELNDKDRLAFYDALILEQFTGKKTALKGMAKFAYISQQHSIDSQINGYNQRLKRSDTKFEPLSTLPPPQGSLAGASVQEKDEEKEKVEVKLPKPNKISFEESGLYDKHKFAETFNEWSKSKLAYYYEAALSYSIEGNKYVDWAKAIGNWAKRDELAGKLKFTERQELSQEELNKIKEREFYARL